MNIKIKEMIEEGETLVNTISKYVYIKGMLKVKAKVAKEIEFLKNFDEGKNKEIKADHLASTNLHYFKALVSCLISCRNVVAVFQCFYLKTKDGTVKQIKVDIVSENGKVWVKVSARNPKALLQLSLGQGEYGQRSILDQAEDLVACASQCKHQFTPPLVVFHFSKTLESVLVQQLESLGVKISMGDIYLFATIDDEEVTHPFVEKDIDKLNLDVSTMIAYISALTNGSANFIFCEQMLNDQAEQERKEPLKPLLDKLFEGKSLLCCETAKQALSDIIRNSGGTGERSRMVELMSRVTVVPDNVQTPYPVKIGGKIKERSLIVFCTGDALKAITVSANRGFFSSAKYQGKEFVAWLHDSRALTELKQATAKPFSHT